MPNQDAADDGEWVPPLPGDCAAAIGTDWFCTLRDAHEGPHQAWTCVCAPDGSCADEPSSLAESWA